MKTFHFQIHFENDIGYVTVTASDHLAAWSTLFRLLSGHMTRKGSYRINKRTITSIEYLGL
jgi:hypothetical protein